MVRRVVEGGQTPEALSAAVGVCPRTVRKWVKRFRAEGFAGLQDRSSRPHRVRGATPPQTVACIESLRRQRWTGAQIARETGVSKANVSRIAFAQVMPDERKESATAFLKAAIAYYQSLGIPVVRVMTDNGSVLRPLVGELSYEVTFPKGQLPPARGFWSLTVYNPQHCFTRTRQTGSRWVQKQNAQVQR